ncbi:DinB family protein [Terracoccus sp. 273MFTsu3.1]|uniref:DinB family protein n=1 Tax=Terracoccus sp. 273MFTsu3.1 TaxID=1172188 RepID=UPI0003652CA5|nr:DinB family protein [Terracoccus sp. 273MFTsu3.1]
MTWTAPDVSLPQFEPVGDERTLLEARLGWRRAVLLDTCAGLTGEQLAVRSVPPSNLSLLGLVRHMAKVERGWFREFIGGEELEPMYDPALGPDADFEDLDPARAEADYERLVEECRRAETALAAVSLDDVRATEGGSWSVRAVVGHMISEYAQHSGHADLLRECIDGRTGRSG